MTSAFLASKAAVPAALPGKAFNRFRISAVEAEYPNPVDPEPFCAIEKVGACEDQLGGAGDGLDMVERLAVDAASLEGRLGPLEVSAGGFIEAIRKRKYLRL